MTTVEVALFVLGGNAAFLIVAGWATNKVVEITTTKALDANRARLAIDSAIEVEKIVGPLRKEISKDLEAIRAAHATQTARDVAADVEPMKAALGVAAAAAIEPMKAALSIETAAVIAREVEPLRAQLAADAARTVAKEVEPLRNELAKDLETVRSLLTLDSEVRRQVAARKVDLLMRLVEAADEVWTALHDSGAGTLPESADRAIETLDGVGRQIRVAIGLLDEDGAKDLWTYFEGLQSGWRALSEARHNGMHGWREASQGLSDARTKLLQVVRRELLVTPRDR